MGRCSSSCSAAASIATSPARSATRRFAARSLRARSCPAGGSSATISSSPSFSGYDFQHHRLTPDDLQRGCVAAMSARGPASRSGTSPHPRRCLPADASVSTVGPSYDARLAAGWRAFDAFYVGPEVQAFGADGNYRQVRGRPSRHRLPDRRSSNGRPARDGPPTPTTEAAPTEKSACSPGVERSAERAAKARQPFLPSQIQARITQSLPPYL